MEVIKWFLNLLGRVDKTAPLWPCSCTEPPFHFENYTTLEIGEDTHGADVSVLTCKHCGDLWLTYQIEWPHYRQSGRWWRVRVSPEKKHSLTTATAKEFVECSPEAFAGGSFFNSHGHRITAPINVG
ncbi:hypothetical protein [Massilia sp. YIM B02443]|uniref:hypothetical protein n=1 Tax=Massilia sp. YIM B02443 TaxID=3050127 RepID=UPI0025B733A9|nr:hypothetical protein [Massilia sp. YIM B02443]MDN4037507.1 hypothetical protein [Massilia sp. YIM B02443]